jgi:hypothetical protein
MADTYDTGAVTEKMADLESDRSSTGSISSPIETTTLDLEKTASEATQKTTRSARTARSDRAPPQTADDWDGEDDPGMMLRLPMVLSSLISSRQSTELADMV